MKFVLEIGKDLYLLALAIQGIAHSSILKADVLFERNIGSCGFLYVASTGNKFVYIETCASYGKKTHGSEHRETSAHVVGNYERCVAFLVGCGTCSTLVRIGYGYYHLAGNLFASLVFALLF